MGTPNIVWTLAPDGGRESVRSRRRRGWRGAVDKGREIAELLCALHLFPRAHPAACLGQVRGSRPAPTASPFCLHLGMQECYHFISTRMAKVKKTGRNEVGKDVEKSDPSYTEGGNVKQCSHYGRHRLAVPQKLKHHYCMTQQCHS